MNRSAVSSSAAASPGADAADVVTPIVLKTSVPCPPERAFAYFTRDIARWWPLATYSCGGFEKLGDRALQAKSEYENGWPTVFGRLYPAYCSDAHKEDRS